MLLSSVIFLHVWYFLIKHLKNTNKRVGTHFCGF